MLKPAIVLAALLLVTGGAQAQQVHPPTWTVWMTKCWDRPAPPGMDKQCAHNLAGKFDGISGASSEQFWYGRTLCIANNGGMIERIVKDRDGVPIRFRCQILLDLPRR